MISFMMYLGIMQKIIVEHGSTSLITLIDISLTYNMPLIIEQGLQFIF